MKTIYQLLVKLPKSNHTKEIIYIDGENQKILLNTFIIKID